MFIAEITNTRASARGEDHAVVTAKAVAPDSPTRTGSHDFSWASGQESGELGG
jgi:hypothetical protein